MNIVRLPPLFGTNMQLKNAIKKWISFAHNFYVLLPWQKEVGQLRWQFAYVITWIRVQFGNNCTSNEQSNCTYQCHDWWSSKHFHSWSIKSYSVFHVLPTPQKWVSYKVRVVFSKPINVATLRISQPGTCTNYDPFTAKPIAATMCTASCKWSHLFCWCWIHA